MLLIECKGCGSRAFGECELAPQNMQCGKPDCVHLDPDGFFDSLTGCKCCPQDHHHGNAASGCPADHAGQPCPFPAGQCPVWASGNPSAHLLPGDPGYADPGPCPGGHCAVGVAGCTVCRPLAITVLPGSATVHHVSGLV